MNKFSFFFFSFFFFFLKIKGEEKNDEIFYKGERRSEKNEYLQLRVRAYLGILEWRERDSEKENDLMLQEFRKNST